MNTDNLLRVGLFHEELLKLEGATVILMSEALPGDGHKGTIVVQGKNVYLMCRNPIIQMVADVNILLSTKRKPIEKGIPNYTLWVAKEGLWNHWYESDYKALDVHMKESATTIDIMQDKITTLERKLAVAESKEYRETYKSNKLKLNIGINGSLDFTINDILVISTSSDGSIVYKREESAKKEFKRWLKNGAQVTKRNVEWKGVTYYISGKNKGQAELMSTSKNVGHYQNKAFPIFDIVSGLGRLNCKDKNFYRMDHNKRVVILY